MSGSPAVLRGLSRHLGCDPRLRGLGQLDFETTLDQLPPDPAFPDFPDLATIESQYTMPTYDEAWAQDIGTGESSVWTALPDGSMLEMTDASTFFDEASGMNYQMSWDGTVLYEDGTAIKPDGSIMTPGGTVVNPDYSMTLTNGDTIPAATVMPDGSTAGFNLDAAIKTGLSLTQAALQVLGKLGVAATPPRTVMSSGQISPASTGWVNQTQYRTPTGQLVQPQQLANGLYQLPDGSVVGGPAPSMFGMSQNTLLIAGGLGVAALLLMRR